MATKQELIEEAQEFAKELGVEAQTDGLNHSELTALVADLEKRFDAKLEGTESEPAAEATKVEPDALKAKPARPPVDGAGGDSVGGPPPKAKPAAQGSAPYVIAPGKSLVCRRGVLGPGDEIRASDVSDGQTQLDYLVRSGHVVKR